MNLRRCGPGALVAAMCIAVPSSSPCGEPADASARPGDRIRVVAPGVVEGRVSATLVAIDEATITMMIEKSEKKIVIPQASVTKLDLLRGKKRCAAKGALVGAIVGAGLMVGYFSGDNDLSENSGTGDVIGGFAFFLLPPTAVGALVGTAIRQDRWVRVDSGLTLGDTHRSAVAVTIRF